MRKRAELCKILLDIQNVAKHVHALRVPDSSGCVCPTDVTACHTLLHISSTPASDVVPHVCSLQTALELHQNSSSGSVLRQCCMSPMRFVVGALQLPVVMVDTYSVLHAVCCMRCAAHTLRDKAASPHSKAPHLQALKSMGMIMQLQCQGCQKQIPKPMARQCQMRSHGSIGAQTFQRLPCTPIAGILL